MVLAVTEQVSVALIGVVAAFAAGIPAIVAAVITARTRRENAEQHGTSADRISELTNAVTSAGVTLGHVREDVREIRTRTDSLAERMTAAETHIQHDHHRSDP